MRIVAFTDIHGSYKKVESALSKESTFDAIVIGGDLTTHGTVNEARETIHRFQKYAKPILVVAGNMDLPAFDQIYESLGVNINARGIVLNDAGFFGIAGSPITPMHTPYEITEDEIRRRAEAGWAEVQNARWKIFVPHAPPFGSNLDKTFLGKHVGSTAIREFVERNQPDALICGHIHESRGTDVLGKTQLVNCGAAGQGYYAVVGIGEEVTIELRG
jgi:Icc-related predicted phosphoesterase